MSVLLGSHGDQLKQKTEPCATTRVVINHVVLSIVSASSHFLRILGKTMEASSSCLKSLTVNLEMGQHSSPSLNLEQSHNTETIYSKY